MYASKKTVKKYEESQDMLKGGAKKAFEEIGGNVCLIGKCGTCGSSLIYYVKSEKENIFNYYCINTDNESEENTACEDKYVRDVRYPFNKDFFIENANPIATIVTIQSEINNYAIPEDVMEQSMSKLACKEFDDNN